MSLSRPCSHANIHILCYVTYYVTSQTQLEHILLRPDTYIGSTEPLSGPMWVLNPLTSKIHEKTITYVPGLFKIFDEILVNAADNKQRDLTMSTMDITVDASTNTISVKNNGKGIPVVMHSEHKCYIPEMIFGHLLTGSNFDDAEKKTTGGRNGYGAKLANIFSTSFTIECVDTENGVKYVQEFTGNMGTKGVPVVTKLTKKEEKEKVRGRDVGRSKGRSKGRSAWRNAWLRAWRSAKARCTSSRREMRAGKHTHTFAHARHT